MQTCHFTDGFERRIDNDRWRARRRPTEKWISAAPPRFSEDTDFQVLCSADVPISDCCHFGVGGSYSRQCQFVSINLDPAAPSIASPPARDFASMAYDSGTGQLVLFGGEDSSGGFLNDTWTWNGATWTQQSPTTSPPARDAASMAYDPGTGQLVLFGGRSAVGS